MTSSAEDLNGDGVLDFSLNQRVEGYLPMSRCGVTVWEVVPAGTNALCERRWLGLGWGEIVGPESAELWRPAQEPLVLATTGYECGPFGGSPVWGGPIYERTNVFLGLRFAAADGLHYAWVHFCGAGMDSYPQPPVVWIVDSGFEPRPGVPIRIGDKPEPPLASPEIVVQPAVVRVPAGSPLTLTLTATGYPSPTFQWYFDGQPVAGATGRVLSVTSARLTDAGEYHATAANALGTVTSQTARVVVGYTLACSVHRTGDVRTDPSLQVYESGQIVEVTAIPRAGQAFLRWEGDAAGTSNPLTLTMDGHKRIVAFFTAGLGEVKWQFLTGGPVESSPALGTDGTVYVGSSDRKLYALDGATGQKLWEFETGGAVESSPTVGADGTVYVGSHDARVYAVNGATGRLRWQFLTGSNVVSSPAIGTDGTVFVGSNDGRLYALNGTTGQKAWEFVTGGRVGSSPAIGLDGTVYVGSSDMSLYALDAASGQVKWEFTAAGVMGSPAIGADGTVYVGSSWYDWGSRSVLYALNGLSGQKLWELADVGAKPVIGSDGTLYVGYCVGCGGAAHRGMGAFEGRTGQKRWDSMGTPQGDSGVAFSSAPAVGADGMVYVTGLATVWELDGSSPWPSRRSFSVFHALEGTNGQAVWGGPLAPTVVASSSSSPTIGPDGTVYFGSADGRVHAYQGSRGLAEGPWPTLRADAQNTGRVRHPTPLRLAISWHEVGARLEWSTPGVLQATEALAPAEWQDVSGVTSPYEVEPANAQRFFRLRRPRRRWRLLPAGERGARVGNSLLPVALAVAFVAPALPASPHLFLDTEAFDHPSGVYRTTPGQ